MTIHKIEHDMESKIRKATVTLNVEQIMYIANALNKYIKEEHNTENLLELHRDIYLLFEIVKNGCIDSVTVEYLQKCQKMIEENRNDKLRKNQANG